MARILSLDGGGGKGVYTLGILKELETLLKGNLSSHFDLIYGTSTGAIIAAGLCTGLTVDQIFEFYMTEIPSIMKRFRRVNRSKALASALQATFGTNGFGSLKTALCVVATNYDEKRPFIFKSTDSLAHGMRSSFVPGFGVSLADAVQASCSAYPFFDIKEVKPTNQESVRLVDGGFCANNPAILAYGDAVSSFGVEEKDLCILSVGTGNYPERYPIYSYLQGIRILPSMKLISTQFSSSSNTIEKIFTVLSKRSSVLRINDSFSDPALATSLFEFDKDRLARLKNKGRDSFASHEAAIKTMFGV